MLDHMRRLDTTVLHRIDRISIYSHLSRYAHSIFLLNESLTILPSKATNIKFKTNGDKTITATGVKFTLLNDKSSWIVNANKEVLLAAGVVGTPQLLELSGNLLLSALPPKINKRQKLGIGNKTLLSALGVQALVDLPGVGENLQVRGAACASFVGLTNYS